MDNFGEEFGFGSDFGGVSASSCGVSKPPLPKVPVSILTGFLGAGKTTLVQHILKNREKLKVGVVVNDMAETNIDAEILQFEDADGIVGLQNGCACCSGRDDLFARLEELVKSDGVSKLNRSWDRLVVECSGVAEPESIASELEAMARRGVPVMQRIFLAGIICVIDASTFWDTYHSPKVAGDGYQSLAVLFASQLESADTVVVNKVDLVDREKLEPLLQLISTLAPNARRFLTTRGCTPLRDIMPADPVNLDMPSYVPTLANRHSMAVKTAESSKQRQASVAKDKQGHAAHEPVAEHGHDGGHSHEDGHSHDHGEAGNCDKCAAQSTLARHTRYGLSSFVYRRSGRKFDARALAVVCKQMPVATAELSFASKDLSAGPANESAAHESSVFQGVVRSKGFIRIHGRDGPYYWSHAGRQLQVSSVSSDSRLKCEQEVVFIGAGMNEQRITCALDACLELSEACL